MTWLLDNPGTPTLDRVGCAGHGQNAGITWLLFIPWIMCGLKILSTVLSAPSNSSLACPKPDLSFTHPRINRVHHEKTEKCRDKTPMFLEKHVSLQGNNQVTDKELSRKCIISNKKITLLLFDCYSFVIRLNIEEQSNKKCEKIE